MDIRIVDDIAEVAYRCDVRIDGTDNLRNGVKVFCSGDDGDIQKFSKLLSKEYGYSVSRGFIGGNGCVIEVR